MEFTSYLLFGMLALVALPLGVFALLLITGVIREPAGVEQAAIGYRTSWRAISL
jgi:hypothetical protein